MVADPSRSPALQLVVLGSEQSRTLDLPAAGTLTIGRGEDSDVCIDDPAVSRRHALLHIGPTLVLEDLKSANGTMIRDRPGPGDVGETLNVRHLVGRQATLAVGDALVFGTASVVVRRAPAVEVPDLTCHGALVMDPSMRTVYDQAARAALAPITVLLLGETGVGKEVLARAIHAGSPRAKKPFLAFNCAALSDSLLESELFGHEKGAFTGALQPREGLFETAAGGTVLLDEVGELSPATQGKLLRVLEERSVFRLGSSRARPIDVRLLAATNRDLETDARTGRFRADLYFRLNGLSLTLPPLRERPAELECLAERFLAAGCKLIDRGEIPRLSPAALDHLRAYAWPGNVRELRNAMERVAVLCPRDSIQPEHLPLELTRGSATNAAPASARGATRPPGSSELHERAADLPAEIRRLERARIVQALEQARGSQSDAARALGISRRTLISRIEAFGLPRPRKPVGESEH